MMEECELTEARLARRCIRNHVIFMIIILIRIIGVDTIRYLDEVNHGSCDMVGGFNIFANYICEWNVLGLRRFAISVNDM